MVNRSVVAGHVFATRDGREKRFLAPIEHWRFLLTWSPDVVHRLAPRMLKLTIVEK